MNLKLIGVALLPLLPAASVSGAKEATNPPFVRLSLAGQKLQGSGALVQYDAKSRLFLIATGLCNGSRDLILTPSPAALGLARDDRKYLQNKNVRRTKLALPHSGSSVHLGDAPAQVQRKLGAPPQQIGERRDLNGREWIYMAAIRVPGLSKPQNYSARYLFRGDRLWAIRYSLSEADGCD